MNNVQKEIQKFLISGDQKASLGSHYSEINSHVSNSTKWQTCSRGWINPALDIVITRLPSNRYIVQHNY